MGEKKAMVVKYSFIYVHYCSIIEVLSFLKLIYKLDYKII